MAVEVCPECGEESPLLQTEAQCEACGHVLFHFVCPTCEHERAGGYGHGSALRRVVLKDVPEQY